MKTPTDPTGLMLVGFLLIGILTISAAASELHSSQEQLNKLVDQQHQKSPLGILKVGAETVNFPWFSQEDRHAYPNLPGSTPVASKKEDILMDNSHPTAIVQDLSAMNRQLQRDVAFKDSQSCSPDDGMHSNRQEISISGTDADEYEEDPADNPLQENSIVGQGTDNKRDKVGNYLNIDVHDISVRAINTMEGGSAVANSNIIINPVQIIVRSPEVGIKL